MQRFLMFCFVLTLGSSAFGYIDGGTGSMLLQVAVSGVLGGIFVMRSFFASIPDRLRRRGGIGEKRENHA
jgi:ABC-type glycerol-3-phosphate transport system permease component